MRAAMLEAKGLSTVEDMLAYLPVRYEDRSNLKKIRQLAPGEMATVIADVRSARLTSLRRGRGMGIFEAVFTDTSGGTLTGKWFNGGYLANVLVPGLRVALFGKIEPDSFSGQLSITKPEFEVLSGDGEEPDPGLHTGRIVPVYEATGKITARIFRNVMRTILDGIEPLTNDPLPAEVRRMLKLPDRWTATQQVHFPGDTEDVRLLNSFRSQAQFRLIFEEFFWLETGLALKRSKARAQPGISFELTERVRDTIKKMLPFKPTGAQKRVLSEIAHDMSEPHPMHRLLQGDVGSGKTLVAAEAAVIAIENGFQVALLAPTEILAAQHEYSLKNLFNKLGYVTVLLTGLKLRARKATAEAPNSRRPGAYRHRDARNSRERCSIQEAGVSHHRRAASIRRDAAIKALRERTAPGHLSNDRHADPTYSGIDYVRRLGHVGHRRATAGPKACRDQTCNAGSSRTGLSVRSRAGERRTPGICCVPHH